MARWYAATLLLGAALLFWLEPMVGRLLLPVLGGGPGVWNVCLVFFQVALLLGYLYAHWLPARLGTRRHAALHLVLLAAVFVALPIGLPAGWAPPATGDPTLPLLGLLALVAGLPFFALATTAPLLQSWFSRTGHARARDPYFLYGASNVGSVVALLLYPTLVETSLGLSGQARLFTFAYGAFVALVAGAAVVLWRAPARAPRAEERAPDARGTTDGVPDARPVTAARRARWILLAFVPSSLVLSVTTTITTDLAAIPLLWVVPLAIYLATWAVAFGRRRGVPLRILLRWLPLVVLVLTLVLLSEATQPIGLLVGLHLVGCLWIGLACHGRLAADRPAPGHLTEYYLWLGVGGAAGGLLNVLLAPLLFDSLAEYPVALVLAAALVVAPDAARAWTRRACILDLALPASLLAVTAGLVLAFQSGGLAPGPESVAAMFAVPVVLAYVLSTRPLRFAGAISALFLAGGLYHGVHGRSVLSERTFFGIYRVTVDPTARFRRLVDGNTVHGEERLGETGPPTPLTYYHPTGPVGRAIAALDQRHGLRHVGVVGLGAGSLAAYARAGQDWTWFELDPAVVEIARRRGGFTFLDRAAAPQRFVTGDARRALARSTARFDLLVIDAFSSDAIPVHLLTEEALAVYVARLAEGGVLAFNVSNRYLDLAPELARLAAHANPPLEAAAWADLDVPPRLSAEGKSPSWWVVMARRGAELDAVLRAGDWRPLHARPGERAWTDDHVDLFRALR